MGTAIDITNRRFGRLIATHVTGKNARKNVLWHCDCDCGATIQVAATCLLTGNTQSCGCARVEAVRAIGKRNRTHGAVGSREHTTWKSMLARCLNPNATGYKHYGSRGITVCPEWRDFEVFLRDMGPRPSGHTLDRIDNHGNYEPNNCRWATYAEQRRNQRPRNK